ncbi:MAG: response regulator transcription factor [Chloroflexota bacterium]|nr:response regulator transcription factor [Chloroflexota bacterium]
MLIADDAPDVAQVVAFGVRMALPGCEVVIAGDGAEALRRFQEAPADLVVLDVSMPPPDGFEVCQRIRALSDVPILMLTVHSATMDKVRALELGADDYLTKPFDHLELFARLRALMRRAAGPSSPALGRTFLADDFSLDYDSREVRVRGAAVRLTSTEYRLLVELVRHAGTVVPHQVLLERVWGPEYGGDLHYLKVFVGRLHQKLDREPGHPRYIQSEWGVGYRFVAHA